MDGTFWQRKDNWVGAEIDDALVMLDFENGTYVSLNQTASDVWNALERSCSADQIIDQLSGRYLVDRDHCSQAVHRLLDEFHRKGLVEPAGNPS